jgi:hypothetical protein
MTHDITHDSSSNAKPGGCKICCFLSQHQNWLCLISCIDVTFAVGTRMAVDSFLVQVALAHLALVGFGSIR